MTVSRRKAREAALRAAYQIDITGETVADAVVTMGNWVNLPKEMFEYAERLIRGIDIHIEFLNQTISANLNDWSLDRLGMIERNILRLAAYEILFVQDMPPAVTINEAIEITRKYSTEESVKFINGVLGGILSQSPKANWTPKPEEVEAPPEPEEPAAEVEEELTIEAADKVKKLGAWAIRTEE